MEPWKSAGRGESHSQGNDCSSYNLQEGRTWTLEVVTSPKPSVKGVFRGALQWEGPSAG